MWPVWYTHEYYQTRKIGDYLLIYKKKLPNLCTQKIKSKSDKPIIYQSADVAAKYYKDGFLCFTIY